MTGRADRSDPAASRASGDGPPAATGRSPRPHGPAVWTIGVAAFLIVGALTLRVLLGNDLDPSAFVAFGDDSPVQTPYGRRLLGDVVTRPGGGHDGQAFFIQANDPWYLQPERHAALLDRPVYRAQRMLFPTLAGGFGLFPPTAIVWAMLVINVLALIVGAIVASKLAAAWGLPTWLGLWVPLNVGLLFEFDIGGSGIVAYVCCLAGLLALVRGRSWLAGGMFAAATLSRETMLAFAVGVLVWWWIQHREVMWRLIALPLAALAVWDIYVLIRLAGIEGVGRVTHNFTLPFAGLLRAPSLWLDDPLDLIVNVVLVAVVVAFVPLALRSRSAIAWGALPFVAIAAVLSAEVWAEPFNWARAVAPIWTALPFAIMANAPERSSVVRAEPVPVER